MKNPRILITGELKKSFFQNSLRLRISKGGLGQLGSNFAPYFRSIYGSENVIVLDMIAPNESTLKAGPFVQADVLDMNVMKNIIKAHHIDWIIHLVAIVSAAGEQNVPLALKINIQGTQQILDLATQYNLRVFIPSSIGAFGPDTPRDGAAGTPNVTIQRPRTIYGVSKVYAELLGEYYQHKFGVDFLCLRFPGIISPGPQAFGTTDFSIDMFYAASSAGKYECYLTEDTMLPMMHIDDCKRALAEFMATAEEKLKRRTYNITGFSFTPAQLASKISGYLPNFVISYKPDFRQKIGQNCITLSSTK